jgi:hypothetical protein
VRIDRCAASVSVSVTGLFLIAACHRVHEPGAAPSTATAVAPAKDAALTTFDWAPPCRVPVRELRADDDETRRVSYVLELTRGPGDRLELRQRDFRLLELNGEDMTTPEHLEQGPGLLVNDEMVPPIYVSASGEPLGVGPLEGKYAQATEGGPVWPRLEDRTVEQWRTWVGAWTAWSVAPGQTRDTVTKVDTREAGTLAASDHAEHQGADAAGVKLRLTRSLEAPAVQRKYAFLLHDVVVADDHYVTGHERTTYSVETDAATLRPAHARFELEGAIELSESGALKLHTVRDTTFDWAHAEGCKR